MLSITLFGWLDWWLAGTDQLVGTVTIGNSGWLAVAAENSGS